MPLTESSWFGNWEVALEEFKRLDSLELHSLIKMAELLNLVILPDFLRSDWFSLAKRLFLLLFMFEPWALFVKLTLMLDGLERFEWESLKDSVKNDPVSSR